MEAVRQRQLELSLELDADEIASRSAAQDIDTLIAELEAQQGPAEIEDPGPEEPPANPVTRAGDLWLLGAHRLLCGDSTKVADLERLMAGNRAALLATDPPYCVDYTGMDRPIHDGKPSGKDWSRVYRDVEIEDLGQFLDATLTACLPQVEDEAGIYLWHAHVQQPVIAEARPRAFHVMERDRGQRTSIS